MIKVIGGKQYNRDTAKRLGKCYGGSEHNNDFGYWEESLYRTKSGNYFLHGYGGPLTRYATVRGNNSGWGEQIIPMTYEQSVKWAEDNLDGEDYIAAFGVPDDDDTRPTISISKETKRKLDEIQSRTGKQQIQIVEELILKAYSEGFCDKKQ